MPLDLTIIPPIAREQYIRVGTRYSSTDTLEQAAQTLSALNRHGPHLEPYGFVAEDTERLTGAHDLLSAANLERESARGDKRVSSAAYIEAFAAARSARKRGRAILTAVRTLLRNAGETESVTQIDTVLYQTVRASTSSIAMATQLDLMANTLAQSDIALVAAKRNGPKTIAALRSAASSLRNADRAASARAGTPAETQTMDLLDGIIIELVRQAKDAAVAAGEDLGNPALVREFKLDKLYRARRSQNPADDADDEEDDTPDPANS